MHNDLTEELNRYKNRLQGAIDLVFPEYNTLFKTKYSKAYMAILKAFPSATHIATTHLTTLKNTLGNMVNVDAKELREVARQSVGEENSSIVLEIQQLIASIELVQKQVKEVDVKIEEFAIHSNAPILSIPGIGVITGMSIVSEIGDIEVFSHASKVIGFAGVDPATYQSGEYHVRYPNVAHAI